MQKLSYFFTIVILFFYHSYLTFLPWIYKLWLTKAEIYHKLRSTVYEKEEK